MVGSPSKGLLDGRMRCERSPRCCQLRCAQLAQQSNIRIGMYAARQCAVDAL